MTSLEITFRPKDRTIKLAIRFFKFWNHVLNRNVPDTEQGIRTAEENLARMKKACLDHKIIELERIDDVRKIGRNMYEY